MFLLSGLLAADGINIGDVDNIWDGYLEYIVGFAEAVPVVDEAVALVHFMFLNMNLDPVEVTLSPVSTPSVPGQMVFSASEDFDLQQMYPVSGHPDAPVFIFGGMAIPVERESFGSIKALYR